MARSQYPFCALSIARGYPGKTGPIANAEANPGDAAAGGCQLTELPAVEKQFFLERRSGQLTTMNTTGIFCMAGIQLPTPS